ncbi:MAG: preprotein translocase subunit YajC [Ilumatobacteraceae bacterium]|jgi:preprotein translocase subunit YajC
MFVLSVLAQDDNGGSATGAVVQIGILLLIPVGMYFLMIRPQRRRMRAQAEMQSSLDVGDEVITTAGIYGFITGFDDDRVWLEIDDDVQVRVSRAALQGKVDTGAPTAPPTKSDSSTDNDAES